MSSKPLINVKTELVEEMQQQIKTSELNIKADFSQENCDYSSTTEDASTCEHQDNSSRKTSPGTKFISPYNPELVEETQQQIKTSEINFKADFSQENCDDGSTTEDASTCEHQDNSSRKTGPGTKFISPYNKRRILKLLMTNGCSAWNYAQTVGKFQVDPDHLREYLNQHIKQAVKHVSEECDSLCFENITDWLMLLEEMGFNEFCDFEPALIIKTIAHNEKQPDANEMNGIDLKAIYKFLGNALMGLPQAELNVESAKFLADEFESLINDVNETEAEDETKQIKDILLANADYEKDVAKLRGKLSLDPLEIDAAVINLL